MTTEGDRRGSRPARLADVAAKADVSMKTVSTVVNGRPHVSERTRSKVTAAMKELGYRANPYARALAGRRTGFIALAIPGLENPYYSTLADHVIAAARRRGWTVLIEQTSADEALERAVVDGPAAQLGGRHHPPTRCDRAVAQGRRGQIRQEYQAAAEAAV